MAKAKPGDILFFKSNQVIGYKLRLKIHVFLGQVTDYRAPNPFAFLFISTANYGNCFPIKSVDYPFLQYNSFISCADVKFYALDYLNSISIEPKGSLRITDASALRNHLVGHPAMPAWQILLTCNILGQMR